MRKLLLSFIMLVLVFSFNIRTEIKAEDCEQLKVLWIGTYGASDSTEYASIEDEGDPTFSKIYKFVLEQDAVVTVHTKAESVESTVGTMNVTIGTSASFMQPIASFTTGATTVQSLVCYQYLKAGTYFIKVENSRWTSSVVYTGVTATNVSNIMELSVSDGAKGTALLTAGATDATGYYVKWGHVNVDDMSTWYQQTCSDYFKSSSKNYHSSSRCYRISNGQLALSESGNYTVVTEIVPSVGNSFYVSEYIQITNADTVKPVIGGVSNKKIYKTKRTITFSDSETGIAYATLDGKEINSGESVGSGKHKLVVVDNRGNCNSISFVIDNKKPVITLKPANRSRVIGSTYYTNVTVRFKDSLSGVKNATLNGKKIKSGTIICQTGTYKLKVTDKAGNVITKRFRVDLDN